jgi:hypothetical protein
MKDKMWLCNKKNVLHLGYEGQNLAATRKMSFIRSMKDKIWLANKKNVLHPVYEGQNWLANKKNGECKLFCVNG